MQQYLARARRGAPAAAEMQFVHVDPDSTAYRGQIQDMFDSLHRPALDPQALERHIQLLYGRGYLETLDYRLEQDPAGNYGLDFTALRNSWGPNYLRLGVQMQDDFEGNTIFNAAGRLDLTELNSLGAESGLDLQVGTAPLLGDGVLSAAVERHALFRRPARAGSKQHDIAQVEDGAQVGEYLVRSFDYGLDFGREFGNWGELRFGAQEQRGS